MYHPAHVNDQTVRRTRGAAAFGLHDHIRPGTIRPALDGERRLDLLQRGFKGTKYSPLDQINAGNFGKLELAWRFKTDMLGPRPEYKLEGTPVAVNGVLYTTGGTRRRWSRSTAPPAN